MIGSRQSGHSKRTIRQKSHKNYLQKLYQELPFWICAPKLVQFDLRVISTLINFLASAEMESDLQQEYKPSPEAAKALLIWDMIVRGRKSWLDKQMDIRVALERGLFNPNMPVTSVVSGLPWVVGSQFFPPCGSWRQQRTSFAFYSLKEGWHQLQRLFRKNCTSLCSS